MKRIISNGHWLYGSCLWILFGVVLLAAEILVMPLRKPSHARAVVRGAARILVRLAGISISVRGLERLPRQPHILLVNHTSFLDPIVLAACLPARPGYAFVVRQQHRSQALLWPLLKPIGTVVLKPSDPQRHSSNVPVLEAAIRAGNSLIVFPEGGFVPEAGLRHFHSGAFVAAAVEHVPVVVAGLRGTRQALPLGRWLPRRVPIALEIGAVLAPGANEPHALEQWTHLAYEAMLPLTGERQCDG